MKNKLIVSTSSLFALLLWSNSGFAACKISKTGYATQHILIDIGTLTISPDAAVGSILTRGPFTINRVDNIATCDNGGGKLYGDITQGTSTPYANVYSTNIEGIGLRFYIKYLTQTVNYPMVFQIPAGTVSFTGGNLYVDVVKTAKIVGTGTLRSPILSSYFDGDGTSKAIFDTTLTGQSTSPTCLYRDNTDGQTVELDKVGANEFTGIGSVAKQKDFSLKLTCNGNTSDQKLNLTFAYTQDSSAGANGVMQNTTGKGYATGVGVQILKDDATTKVKNGDKLSVATINKNTASNPELKLKAQYYQTAAQVTAGKVFTSATVTISYE